MIYRLFLILLAATAGFASDVQIGLGPVPVNGGAAGVFASVTDTGLTSGRVPYASTGGLLTDAATLLYAPTTGLTADQLTSSGLTSGRITTAGTAGKLSDFAGFALIGTPSATAPNTGTNGPGLLNGVQIAGADGSGTGMVPTTFGNGVAQNTYLIAYNAQGTAASPGASIVNDGMLIALRGHDGTNFTGSQASIALRAGSTWSPTSRESFITFTTTPSGSTANTTAGRIDSNATLCWGGSFSGVGTFSAGTQRPHIQTAGSSASACNIAQTFWAANASGPTSILGKSRGNSSTSTQGVITTGDTLGTMSWQGDDGTDFIEAASIVVTATGTLGTGQIPGSLAIKVANSAGTNAARLTITATGATFASGTPITVSDTTASTTGATGCIITSGGVGAAGAFWSSLAPAAATSPAFGFTGTSTITGGVTDAYTGAHRISPTFSAASSLTVTRYNYLDFNNPVLAGVGPAALTDACVIRFDAAAGTHKAVDASSTKTTPGTVNAWMKININGTIYFIPCYTSKTS